MLSELSAFYTSQKWREFRRALIAERTNPHDGILYSEYSGKPIANGSETVLHHKQPLTAQNVDDASISLNPENIMVCTIKEHNEIHRRFGNAMERKVYLVYGAPCSGKTTFVRNNKGNGDLVVDMDALWQAVTGQPYYKPQALKQNVFELRRLLLDQVKTRYPRQGWERAWIITGGARKTERERMLSEYGAEPIFIDATKDECLQRLTADDARAPFVDEWRQYINDWYLQYTE